MHIYSHENISQEDGKMFPKNSKDDSLQHSFIDDTQIRGPFPQFLLCDYI